MLSKFEGERVREKHKGEERKSERNERDDYLKMF